MASEPAGAASSSDNGAWLERDEEDEDARRHQDDSRHSFLVSLPPAPLALAHTLVIPLASHLCLLSSLVCSPSLLLCLRLFLLSFTNALWRIAQSSCACDLPHASHPFSPFPTPSLSSNCTCGQQCIMSHFNSSTLLLNSCRDKMRTKNPRRRVFGPAG